MTDPIGTDKNPDEVLEGDAVAADLREAADTVHERAVHEKQAIIDREEDDNEEATQ
ncbi:hypothetical protein [Corynebacterium pygosceleis]|uniref:Uncharacterized protein n=1 Tax=Corynebacterium pygosceleis TaxID=2800406 RepID=A0A9Q4GL94_9CORY|nr:hypothetical protein [Corynebacterium pygosceleis]MCK7638319.1 hypothetical protein [Corynebacterium pygosceleis]MCK7675299.1 hypothetical protein [Corynebacterium pygosceleis]MCL0121307.1 hypothetical protein [Corynebacterium pygosceleis]MCX7445680.1 hypothetical protein [Corynebacterium pygosceleis]MCX7468982.1 hypothetical protein [Corynebacterium pygosceleis]